MFRKISRNLLALVIALSLTMTMPLAVRAKDAVWLAADRTNVAPGEQFVVAFMVGELPNLFGAQFSLTYDNTLLEVVELQTGDAWTAAPFEARKTFTAGGSSHETIEYAATLFNPSLTVGAGSLLKVVFQAKSVPSTVTTQVSLGSSLPLILADNQAQSIPVTEPSPVEVTIQPTQPPTQDLVTLVAPSRVRGGEKFTVLVQVKEVPNLYGVQFSLSYDGTRLKALQVKLGEVWLPGSTFVARKTFTHKRQPNQRIEFAATLTDPQRSLPAGTLLEITFRALNTPTTVKTALLGESTLPLILSDNQGNSIPTAPISAVEVTICPSPGIKGSVHLQARGEVERPITIVVTNPTIQEDEQISSGESFDIAALEGSGYTLVISSPCHVGITLEGVSAPASLGEITLLAGDVNGDGVITIADVSAVASQYGKSAVSGCANLTGDAAGLVNIQDLSLVARNMLR